MTTTKLRKPDFKRGDWFKILDWCEQNEVSYHSHSILRKRAFEWPTCACGQLCQKLPKDSFGDGRPADFKLQELGAGFCSNVSIGVWKEARIIMIQIESLTAQLLKEMK